MSRHTIIESVARTNESGTRIAGIAILPQVSRNGVLYLPGELARGDGQTVPLNLMHEDPIRKIGEVTFHWDKEKLQLMYDGTITDSNIADLVKQRELFVSIGADFETETKTCDSKTCYKTPLGLNFAELSVVDTPGIPGATLNVIESFISSKFTSVISPESTKPIMETKIDPQSKEVSTSEDIVVKQTDSKAETETPEPAKEVECPPGQKDDGNGKCIPAFEKPDEKSEGCDCGKTHDNGEANAPNQDKKKDEDAEVPKVQVDLEPLKNSLQKGLDGLAQEIGVIKQSQERAGQIARVSTENGSFTEKDMKSLAQEWVRSIGKNGSYSWEVDLTSKEVHEAFGYSSPFDYLRNDYKVTEALSFTQGDVSNEIGDTSIITLPGGKYNKSIRDLVVYKEIPKGADTFTVFTADQPDETTITEGRTTAAAEAAQDTFTISPVDMTANVTTGYYTQITKSQMQKSPIAFMKYLNEVAKKEAVHREAVSVFNTTVDAVAAPTNWVDATDGTELANQTAEDAVSGTFDPKAISTGMELLGDAGYIDGPGQAFAAVTWKQYKQLREDSDLQRLVQEGNASITRTGDIGQLYGCDIIPVPKTLIQETASNTLRAVMGKKNHTFWLASGRNISIETQKEVGKLTVDVSMDKQINSGLIDELSLVVLCSSA